MTSHLRPDFPRGNNGSLGHEMVFLVSAEKGDINLELYSQQKLSIRNERNTKSFSG